MIVRAKDELTPVQEVNGLLIKRDDLYAPFGEGDVNGGKLRQCVMLIDSAFSAGNGAGGGIFTYCSVHSPQAPITAAVARSRGLPCYVVYGASEATIRSLPMPRLAMKHGAEIVIAAKGGRHSILYARTKALAEKKKGFIVQYGINLTGYGDVLLDAVAAQCENIPDEIENLVMTCGSGITASGVMVGIKKYRKKVKRVHLVATAPDRRTFIHDNLRRYNADRDFEYHSLFDKKGFRYENGENVVYGGIKMHPQYEAKTMKWFWGSGLNRAETLFWIVGAEPTR